MILRKLANAIRQQNWFTVLLEILIVVIGIYLGIQASNWNQDREDRLAEFAYLERITEDLQASLLATTNIIDFQSRNAKYGIVVLQALRACQIEDDRRDQFASGIYLVGKHAPAHFVQASIQELLSAGRLAIIRDPSLRQSLVELLQFHDDHLFYMSDVQLRVTPHVNYIDSVAPIIVDGPIGGGTTVVWDRLDADFEDLCSDRRFYTAMASSLNYIWDSTDALSDWLNRLRAVKAKVDAEISKLIGANR